ncbi:MAG: hypothetical protein QG623_186, partial [Patescibacteria group bacterium]|nr:hypothetical protein [Patescibacteria group bacterium]
DALPIYSTLDLAKIKGQGFTPDDWKSKLREYVTKEMEKV